MTWMKENKKYLVGIISFILIVFLMSHDVYNIGIASRRLTVIDFMSAEAFESWLNEIESIKNILEPARTNLDVKEAMNYTSRAISFVNILDWQIEVIPRQTNFVGDLYSRIALATVALDRAIFLIATKPSTTLRDLDEATLQILENLTNTIENLVDLVGTVDYDVSPVQQLEQNGILTQVKSYVDQIKETSLEIWEMYY
jgi:hypothetical protein